MEKPSLSKDQATASTGEFVSLGGTALTGELTIGHYRLLECIGQGGMGTVYKAQHTSLKKTVALKVMTTNRGDIHSSARFDREMVALGKLSHPNVVAAFDAGFDGHVQYIVTEYVEGLNVSDLVRRLGPLDPSDASRITSDAAEGLTHIHSQGLVHRDVKPSNLMLTADGQVKVLDLGLALLAPEDANQLTQSGQIMGTFDYMAPEQWGESHAVDARADIYSLGCSLFYMLAGHPPFGGLASTSAQKMKAHLLSPSPSVSVKRADIPREIDRLIHSMLEKDPDRRPQTMADVIAGLNGFARGSDLNDLYRRAMDSDAQPRVVDTAAGDAKTHVADSAAVGAKKRPLGRRMAALAVVAALAVGIAAWYAAGGFGRFGNDAVDDADGNGSTAHVAPTDAETGANDGSGVESNSHLVAMEAKAGTVRRHTARVNGVCISTDGRRVVSAGEDKMMCVFDPQTHKVLTFEQNHPKAIAAVTFLAEGKLATACADGLWRVWSLTSDGQLRAERTSPQSPGSGLWFIRGIGPHRFATGGWDNKVSIWDLSNADKPPITFTRSKAGAVFDAAFSHDGTKLLWCADEGVLRYENLPDRRRLNEWTERSSESVLSVDISADDRYAASAGWIDDSQGTVRVWALEKGDEVINVPCVAPKVVRFFPDGRRVAFGGREGKIVIWDLKLKKQVHVIDDYGPVDCLAIAPDGSYLVSGTDNAYTVSVWPLPEVER